MLFPGKSLMNSAANGLVPQRVLKIRNDVSGINLSQGPHGCSAQMAILLSGGRAKLLYRGMG
jgi:hypothetical protein